MISLRIGAEQCPVADQIDKPGYALTFPIQSTDRPGGKNITPHTGNIKPVLQIGRQFLPVYCIQVVACRDPLIKLAKFRQSQDLLQFRLAKQNNLQQFLFRGFQVGQQAQLFEHLSGEVLGLINNQHLVPARSVGFQQILVDAVDQGFDTGIRLMRYFQFITNGRQQFPGGQARIQDQRNIHMCRRVFYEAATNRGFTGAHLASDHNETALPLHTVHQVRQCFLVAIAEVEISGVGSD